MKKYNIEMKLWSGSTYMDYTPHYTRSIIVRTNSIDYLLKMERKNFSEIDIHTNKVHWYDLETGKRTCEDNLD